MNDIAICGAGGLGREIALMIAQINRTNKQWNLIGFFDDNKTSGEIIDGLPVLGGLSVARSANQVKNLVIAIADPVIRKKIIKSFASDAFDFPILIHPSVNLGDTARNSIGRGCIITAGNILTTNVTIGDFCIVNLMCTIGHDVSIGAFSSIMPGCSLSGFISIGDEVLVGTGARILPQVSIGAGAKIGAGAVVVADVQAGKTAVGVPAKEIEHA